jgi:hypothetical protein
MTSMFLGVRQQLEVQRDLIAARLAAVDAAEAALEGLAAAFGGVLYRPTSLRALARPPGRHVSNAGRGSCRARAAGGSSCFVRRAVGGWRIASARRWSSGEPGRSGTVCSTEAGMKRNYHFDADAATIKDLFRRASGVDAGREQMRDEQKGRG